MTLGPARIPIPASAHWLSVNISVLRTVMDKLGGLAVTEGLRTPKRPRRIPELLKPAEARRLIEAAPTLRDRFLLSVLYGCGLKVGEACGLKWEDVDLAASRFRVNFAGGTRQRWIEFPPALAPLLAAGATSCQGTDYILAGAKQGAHLTPRMAERIVKRAVGAAGLPEMVTCMTLRHSYAVERLRAGLSVRDVQERLGHLTLETTLEYRRCIPREVVSPAERLNIGKVELSPGQDATGQPIPTVDLPDAALKLPIAATAACDVGSVTAPFAEPFKMRLSDRFLSARGSAGPKTDSVRLRGPPG
jgi:integrase